MQNAHNSLVVFNLKTGSFCISDCQRAADYHKVADGVNRNQVKSNSTKEQFLFYFIFIFVLFAERIYKHLIRSGRLTNFYIVEYFKLKLFCCLLDIVTNRI